MEGGVTYHPPMQSRDVSPRHVLGRPTLLWGLLALSFAFIAVGGELALPSELKIQAFIWGMLGVGVIVLLVAAFMAFRSDALR